MKDITFHYTKPEMVRDLVNLLDLKLNDVVLDAGSGKNKVWAKQVKNCGIVCYDCEIEDGEDFYTYNKKYDWIIGNPPFHEGWKFLDKASQIANKGVAFLGNLNFWNSCLPSRFEILKKRGFCLNKIHIVQDKRWFGRYYFLIFTKTPNEFISWNCKTY